jgi:hypothetical protein
LRRRELGREEARLKELEAQCDRLRLRIAELRSEVRESSEPFHPPVPYPSARPTTSSGKIGLFRQLFRGRRDVFPTRWVNAKKGISGYAPACANEWVPEVCHKPRVKCGECPNEAFLSVTDQVILDHFLGRHVAGVYPLLEDDTCWFLAIDFDKGSWRW